MYQFIFFVFCISVATNFQAQKQELNWVGKSNRIVNPGAESNSSGAPLLWKTDYARGSESNWVSEYGVTSHEWNHGAIKAGLPTQPGANYFRLTVDKYNETRKLNIYQSIRIDDLHATLIVDTVMANFSCWIGSTYTTKTNCSFAEVKVIFKDGSGKPLDSIYIKKTPGEFKDLDAVFVTLPNYLAPIVTKDALKNKLHVFCEKPPAKCSKDLKNIFLLMKKNLLKVLL